MREHPKKGKAPPSVCCGQRNTETEKLIPSLWRVSSGGHGRRVPWCSTHWGCLAAPFIPVEKLLFCCSDHRVSQKSWGEATLAGCYVNRASFACTNPNVGWYGNPLGASRGAWWGTGSLEKVLWLQWRWKLMCQSCERMGKLCAVIHFSGKLCFVASSVFLEAEYFFRSIYNTILVCFSRRGKKSL